jgi:hypothetical protein
MSPELSLRTKVACESDSCSFSPFSACRPVSLNQMHRTAIWTICEELQGRGTHQQTASDAESDHVNLFNPGLTR